MHARVVSRVIVNISVGGVDVVRGSSLLPIRPVFPLGIVIIVTEPVCCLLVLGVDRVIWDSSEMVCPIT